MRSPCSEKCKLQREAHTEEMPGRKRETKQQQGNRHVREEATWGCRWGLQPQRQPAPSLVMSEEPPAQAFLRPFQIPDPQIHEDNKMFVLSH